MAVDGRGACLVYYQPTIPRPSAVIPQVYPDTRPPGNGHVTCPPHTGRVPRVLLLLRPITRPPARFGVPSWGQGAGTLRTAGLRLSVRHGDSRRRTGGAAEARECMGAGG